MKKRASIVLCVALLVTLLVPSVAFAAPVPVSATLERSSYKNEYVVGETFSLDGAVVTVEWHDADTNETTYTTEGPEHLRISPDPAANPIKLNINTFGVSWSNGDITFPLAPLQAVGGYDRIISAKMTAAPTKTEYQEGETADPAGINVIATWKSGKTEEWTAASSNLWEINPSDPLTAGATKFTVVFRGTDPSPSFYPFEIPVTVTAVSPEPTSSSTVEPTAEPSAASTQEAAAQKKSPKTGDETFLFPYIFLAVAGFAGILFAVKHKARYTGK